MTEQERNELEQNLMLNDNEGNDETLIDPMRFEDSEETLKKKKEDWDMIFATCPDFTELVLGVYAGDGSEGLSKLLSMFVFGSEIANRTCELLTEIGVVEEIGK